jgi:hypothetical protein
MPSAALRTVPLHPDTAAMLRRPIKGRGGFQALMRRIQSGLRGGTLRVSQDDLDALVRAVRGPQAGGFQRRARAILVDVVMQEIQPAAAPARVLEFRAAQRSLPFGEGPL